MSNKIIFNGKVQDTQFDYNGKTVAKFIYNGKECILIDPLANKFEGTWSTPEKEAMFMAFTTSVQTGGQLRSEPGITSITLPRATWIGISEFQNSPLTSLSIPEAITINDNAFESAKLTSLSLPKAITIGNYAFMDSPLTSVSLPEARTIGTGTFWHTPITSVDLPKATHIGDRAFEGSRLTSLSLPKATTIGEHAFENSPLTNLELPEATTIKNYAFYGIANEPTTTVTLPSKFNTEANKGHIFGVGNWRQITFTWV